MKYIVYIVTALFLVSCTSESQKEDKKAQKEDNKLAQIEKNIQDNAWGAEIGYVPGKLEEVKNLTLQEVQNIYRDVTGENVKDSLDAVIQNYQSLMDKQKQSGGENPYEYWQYVGTKKTLESWRGLQPTDICYQIVKYTYKIDNFLKKGEKREIVNYYIFNKDNKLLLNVLSNTLLSEKKNYIQNPDFAYIKLVSDAESKPDME